MLDDNMLDDNMLDDNMLDDNMLDDNMLDDNMLDGNGEPYLSSWTPTPSAQTIRASNISTMEPLLRSAADGHLSRGALPPHGGAVQTVDPADLILQSDGPSLHQSTIEERLAGGICRLENVPVTSRTDGTVLEAGQLRYCFAAPSTGLEVAGLPAPASPAASHRADRLLLTCLNGVVASASHTVALATNLAAIVRASTNQVPNTSLAHSNASSVPEPPPESPMPASSELLVDTGSSTSSPQAAAKDARPQCHRCPKTLSRRDALKRHIETVHNKTTYPCLVAGCTRFFKRPDLMRRHMRTQH